jgi:uncharacterized protein YtpQ (UPF0354 family)
VRVTSATAVPVLVSVNDPEYQDHNVLDGYFGDLVVGYTTGPPFGERLLTWDDLDRLELSRRELRRSAAVALDRMLDEVRVHGRPPALMLSFDGLESSLLLAEGFWDELAPSVPGDLVIGVPARDVVIITGSRSQAGLEKARRCVDRVFFARGPHLLVPDLLVWGEGGWEPFR